MPFFRSREDALREIREIFPAGTCLVCELLRADTSRVLYRDSEISVLLSAYPRFWGQVMVCVNRHTEKYSALTDTEWAAVSQMALRYARLLEQKLEPARVYVSALGSTRPLLQTCPHLHVNVLPVYDSEIKPAAVFTWEEGLYAGTPEEWQLLEQALQLPLK